MLRKFWGNFFHPVKQMYEKIQRTGNFFHSKYSIHCYSLYSLHPLFSPLFLLYFLPQKHFHVHDLLKRTGINSVFSSSSSFSILTNSHFIHSSLSPSWTHERRAKDLLVSTNLVPPLLKHRDSSLFTLIFSMYIDRYSPSILWIYSQGWKNPSSNSPSFVFTSLHHLSLSLSLVLLSLSFLFSNPP